ncbi:NAD-dependent deacetylase [Bacilli bacterium PM5-9]|nr:NAD-dependent deacetylase [Bacilli bacterium PM5-9]
MKLDEIIKIIDKSNNLVFLTGAGVSTLSGIPDYRSMNGVYSNKENPEYLLSHTCLVNETEKFYSFVKELYHPNAKPNVIHNVMANLEQTKNVTVITQNIDQLHSKAGSKNLLEFHGNLYDLYCMKCHKKIEVSEYLSDYRHCEDGGITRPNVVLYEEGLDASVVDASIKAVSNADTIILVGTSFKVYPFASLLDFACSDAIVVLVNNEDVNNSRIDIKYIGDAREVFEYIDII